jgi:hypothetical protein
VPAAVAGPAPAQIPALAAAAGTALLVLAGRAAFRRRRRRVQALSIPIVVALLRWVVVPAVGAGLVTSAPPRRHRPHARSASPVRATFGSRQPTGSA